MKTKCLTVFLLVLLFAVFKARSEAAWTWSITVINEGTGSVGNLLEVGRNSYNASGQAFGWVPMMSDSRTIAAGGSYTWGTFANNTGQLIPGAAGCYGVIFVRWASGAWTEYGRYTFEQYNIAGHWADLNVAIVLHVSGTNVVSVGCKQNLSFTIKDQTASGHSYGIVNGCDATSEGYHEYFSSGFASASQPMLTLKLDNVDCDKVSCYYVARLGNDTVTVEDEDGKLRKLVKGEQMVSPVNNSTNKYTEDMTTGRPVYDASGTVSSNGANGGIVFSAGAATNISTTIMEGSDALYDAVTKAGQQTHSDLLGLSNAVSRIGNGTNSSGTNGYSLSLTNYATEMTQIGASNTMAGISNLLAGANGTNMTVEAMLQKSAQGAASGSNSLIGAKFDYSDPVTTTTTYGNSGGLNWTVAVPYLGVGSVDLNPMHNTSIAAIATFMRAGLKWACIVGLLVTNCSALMTALNSLGATRQASAASAIMGASAVTALLMAVAITALMLAVPAFAASQFVTFASTVGANPFSGASGIVSASVWLADQFFPLAVIVACPIAHYSFRLSLGAIVWGVQTATRFLVG